MRVVGPEAVDRALTFPILIEALADAFRGGIAAPARHHHAMPESGGTLLLMPAWTGETAGAGGAPLLGVKVVTVFPDNGSRALPSVQGTYLLMDGGTGTPLAAIDGTRLTLWRTAAASALAARHLARPDAARMVMVGAGALAPFLVRAHAAVRPLRSVTVWARRPDAALSLAASLAAEALPAEASDDLEGSVRGADLVSCATLATEPLVRGAWLRAGAHLDLVGAFTPVMREADDEALHRSEVYVDTPAALTEGGDVAVAIRAGTFDEASVRGDLAGLVSGRTGGRSGPAARTMFKSIGASLEDLAAAAAIWRRVGG